MMASKWLIISIMLIATAFPRLMLASNNNESLEQQLKSALTKADACCDINDNSFPNGYTPVMYLVARGCHFYSIELFKYVIEKGYKKELKNAQEETAYDIAKRHECKMELAEVLKPARYIGLFDVTDEEINIVDKTQDRAIELYLSRIKKEHCKPPYNTKRIPIDINKDSVSDIALIYGVGFCGGNQSDVNVAVFRSNKNGLYSLGYVDNITGSAGIDFNTIKISGNRVNLVVKEHRSEDGNCCPTGKIKKTFSIGKSKISWH